jgi:hypothetical protein
VVGLEGVVETGKRTDTGGVGVAVTLPDRNEGAKVDWPVDGRDMLASFMREDFERDVIVT